ncbi:MAG: MBL fold metallo-hydrolase [Helicobacter sp.]|uniref:MBL fold metallo-hydrolase n=1 Tax=Helicobacter sp. TaxID=218 RepID=UPI0025C626D2|nr:MBL fold metallo-hydrolase [Helicobacter sp.]MCH5313381.1 MBL fold metallo-hydrolase [Helicobacter sp.]
MSKFKAKNHPATYLTQAFQAHNAKEQHIIESYSHYEDSLIRFMLKAFSSHTDVHIPSFKSDIRTIPSQESFVWFGHSSFMLWLNGKSVLVDPLIESAASPLPCMFRAFKGADIFSASDFGVIDYLIITHNHYDHLSKKSIRALAEKIQCAIVPLGIGKILRKWGIASHCIIELSWNECVTLGDIKIHCLPSKHYSTRSFFDKNTSLWASFMLQTDNKNIFCSGDSGYGGHFKVIGEQFECVDFAFIENGQYNMRWAHHHLFPHQTLQAAIDIKCKKLMPIHNSKFALAPHHFTQPLKALYALYEGRRLESLCDFTLLTPCIGEIVPLWEERATSRWWESL